MDGETKPYGLMVKYMHKQCECSGWLNSQQCPDPSIIGVVIKGSGDQFSSHPPTINPLVVEAVGSLDCEIAFTLSSEITATLFRQMSPLQSEIVVEPQNIRIPIVESFEDVIYLATTKRLTASACAIRKERVVFVWSESVENILPHGAEVDRLLLETMWGQIPSAARSRPLTRADQHISIGPPSRISSPPPENVSVGEKQEGTYYTPFTASINQTAGDQEQLEQEIYDPELAAAGPAHRPSMSSIVEELLFEDPTLTLFGIIVILTHSFMVGLGMMLLVFIQMGGVAQLIAEICIDGNYARLGYLLLVPLSSTFALFFATTMIACLFQLFGPVADIKGNSRYHSAIAPNPARYRDTEYPHITIQMPVYKEGLQGVIVPTITSLKAAIKHYESIGGTASIFVNEDGMQVVSPELAQARQKYYATNDIGWCARPPHNKDGYIRKGQFKKASNMNYSLNFSIRVEDELLRLIAEYEQQNPEDEVTVAKENELYAIAMEKIIASDEGRTWAGGNVRLGEFILLVDCDTKVPVTCLQYGALEMIESPDVAIVQHASGVMQVVHNLFENAITYLTNLIYTSIQYAVGSGDLACFVGHNAFLRWKAIQSVSFEEDGITKYWSDSHVSEDFDQALRLQIAGFIIRLASYHDGEFKEGVSLTVFDELARWEKYTYGCNELLFNPLIKWPFRGPFTPILWRLIRSNVKSSSKITVIGYVFTYYAMAAALPFCVINYCLMGWIPDSLDHYYLDSFRIMILLLLVFNFVSPIAYNYLLHRMGKRNFFAGLLETIKWMPLFMVFFGGISIHLCKAIFCHFFSINMEWNSTAKELEATGFFIGMDKIINDFKYMYIIVFLLTGFLIYMAIYAPHGWEIANFSMIVPVANQLGCHFLLPLALGLF